VALSRQRKRKINTAIVYVVLFIIGITILVPFFWMVSTSFKPKPEILTRDVRLLPQEPTLDPYKTVFSRVPYWINLFNSFFISSMTTAIAIFLATMTGYGIAKYNSKGLNIIFVFILTALMIPPFVIAIPLYLVAARMGLVNSLIAVIIPFGVSNFGIFLMRQFCLSIPDDLLAASRIDGASEFRTFTQIVFPTVASGWAALGVLKFLMTWNDFFWPLIMLTREYKMTLQVMLAQSIDFEMGVDYGFVMALTTLMVVPILIIFLFFQRRIIEGVSLSGMKG
jgi:multiple sugar transport system permease protein